MRHTCALLVAFSLIYSGKCELVFLKHPGVYQYLSVHIIATPVDN